MAYSTVTNIHVTFPKSNVAHIELSRWSKNLTLVNSTWNDLRILFQNLSHELDVHVIVLSGVGEYAFSEASSNDQAHQVNQSMQECVSAVVACIKPVICTTLGSCWSVGMGLACACDIRISASSVRFVVQEVDIASVSDSATLRLLPKLVGNSSWIRDVVFSAREFGADEALRVGFVSNVLETKDEALCEGLRLAEVIAAKRPSSTQRSKQALWRIRDCQARIQPGLGWNHDYPEAELAADLDQALGVGSLKRAPKL